MNKHLGLLLFVVVVGVGFLFVGCGSDDDNDTTSAAQCEKICQKKIDAQCEGADDTSLDDCIDQCNTIRNKLMASMFNDVYDCLMDLSDEDYCENGEECTNDAMKKCGEKDKANKFLHDYCEKYLSCDQNNTSTVDECVSDMTQYDEDTQILNCFTDAALSDMSSCVSSSTCDEYMQCLIFF